MTLKAYLEKKGAEYAPFDQKRFKDFYTTHLSKEKNYPRVVQIVGTNGKGSTGRFLAEILKSSGFRVGHFTSPHIFSYTERFWIDGADATEDELEVTFQSLFEKFGETLKPLSYFEILTLLGYAFFKDSVDILVLEAGVGGEKDSTTAFKKELLLVTSIDIDHQDLLGNTKDEITKTKLKAANCDTIVGFQSDQTVIDTIKKEFAGLPIRFLHEILSAEDREKISDFAVWRQTPSYLTENLSLAYMGAKALGVTDVRLDSIGVIKGRFEKVAHNVVVDVGHNVAAANRIAKELIDKKVVLIFNCFHDKNPELSLQALKNSVKRVEILSVENERIIKKEALINILEKNSIPYNDFVGTNSDEEYLVFGSFSVVAEFLGRMA